LTDKNSAERFSNKNAAKNIFNSFTTAKGDLVP